MKAADAAKLYYNISQYKAATVAYRSVLRDYPESPNADLYQYMIIKSMYKFAKASIPEKQEERYAIAISAYRELKDNYPKSQYLADAERLSTEAINNVKKIRNE
jgi:outer membrane protein assembly factor BamD